MPLRKKNASCWRGSPNSRERLPSFFSRFNQELKTSSHAHRHSFTLSSRFRRRKSARPWTRVLKLLPLASFRRNSEVKLPLLFPRSGREMYSTSLGQNYRRSFHSRLRKKFPSK